jgi:hypothetical protein
MWPARTLVEGRAATVGGDGHQPREERPFRVPAPQVAHGAHQRLLGGVFRILAVPQHPQAQPEHGLLEPLDELANGRLVARQAPLHEFLDVTRHKQPAFTLLTFAGWRTVSAMPPRSARRWSTAFSRMALR